MRSVKIQLIAIAILVVTIGCEQEKKRKSDEVTNHPMNYEFEKEAILETLNNETKAAFQRDYETWKDKWVHDQHVTKSYMNFADSTFSESVGWGEINQFVRTFFELHPEPEPVPKLLDKIDVRLYENGAWVTYEQIDSIRGRKRETRLMEKVNGSWKIAGMQTTVYGFGD